MAANSNIEILKKNVALVLGLVASILISPPEIESASSPVKWLAINGVLATLIASLFAVWLSKVKLNQLKNKFILTGAALLLVFSGLYYSFYSSWTNTCNTGKNQYSLVVGTDLTPFGENLAKNLDRLNQEPSIENILFINGCSSRKVFNTNELLIRYFLLISIYIFVTILLMGMLSFVNYLIYYHLGDVPKF